jgi:hypothetical protein
MVFWAAVFALVTGAFAFWGNLSSTLVSLSSALLSLAEIGGVIALFMLVCAAEVFSIPKNPSFDESHARPES